MGNRHVTLTSHRKEDTISGPKMPLDDINII